MGEYGHYADRMIDTLQRIADAFEEQNRYNLEWIEIQKHWHAEAEALTEQRYQEKRAQDAVLIKREQEWHDEAERLNELRYQVWYQEQSQHTEQRKEREEGDYTNG